MASGVSVPRSSCEWSRVGCFIRRLCLMGRQVGIKEHIKRFTAAVLLVDFGASSLVTWMCDFLYALPLCLCFRFLCPPLVLLYVCFVLFVASFLLCSECTSVFCVFLFYAFYYNYFLFFGMFPRNLLDSSAEGLLQRYSPSACPSVCLLWLFFIDITVAIETFINMITAQWD